MVIPEIYPGIEYEATVVGADVYQMYDVVDAIAHEYEFGSGEHMAASRKQMDWFLYQAGMLFSCLCARQGHVDPELFVGWRQGRRRAGSHEKPGMSIVMAGANFWDAPGHSMGGSNDLATRKPILTGSPRTRKRCIDRGADATGRRIFFAEEPGLYE